jgi:hypothetical protein
MQDRVEIRIDAATNRLLGDHEGRSRDRVAAVRAWLTDSTDVTELTALKVGLVSER